MGLLFRIAIRLAPLSRLKARRSQLLVEKLWLMDAQLQAASYGADDDLDRLCERAQRLNREVDAINDEIGRRGR